jgi:mannose-6-phosphate isomerase-like protein (cupin superfamily)
VLGECPGLLIGVAIADKRQPIVRPSLAQRLRTLLASPTSRPADLRPHPISGLTSIVAERTPRSGIHDVYTRPLQRAMSPNQADHTVLLRDTDHLLRRFGQAELVELRAGGSFGPIWRAVADEVWVVIEGDTEFRLTDLRPQSPTKERCQSLRSQAPSLVLIPFGVEFSIHTPTPCRLLRFATHADGAHAGDRISSRSDV